MSAERFERDLRASLAARAPTEVPASLRDALAELDPADGRGLRGWLSRLALLSLDPRSLVPTLPVAAVLVGLVVVGAVLLHYAGRTSLPPGWGQPPAISWQTGVASLEADALRIEAGGLTFTAGDDTLRVVSDPGTSSYSTLEVSWQEHQREMRLSIYFAADDSHWWVRELSIRDGRLDPDWITFQGPMFRTQRGHAFVGDIELQGGQGRGPGSVHIDNARLSAFGPGTGAGPFEGCTTLGPVNEAGAPDPLAPDQPLADSGIVGMQAAAAHELLLERGICHDFRLEWPYQGQPNSGFGQRWCEPPPGVVNSVAYGYEGHVILFVHDPQPRPYDPQTPAVVGCQ